MNSVILGSSYIMANTPDMVIHNGTTQFISNHFATHLGEQKAWSSFTFAVLIGRLNEEIRRAQF